MLAVRVQGQVVIGTVVADDDRRPLAGVLVSASASASGDAGRALTGEDGRFRIELDTTGAYTLRVEMIGRDAEEIEILAVARGDTLRPLIRLRPSAVSLPEIAVEAEPRCDLVADAGASAARVWNDIRVALESERLNRASHALTFVIERYVREHDPRGRRVVAQTSSRHRVLASTPFTAAHPEELAESGYLRESSDSGAVLYAPVAETILSDAFLSTHCFQLVRSDDDAHRIGLAFRPVRGTQVVDIRGTLWLAAHTGQLETLDYEYMNIPGHLPEGAYTGEVVFARPGSGQWFVDRWHVQTPIIARSQAAFRDGLRETRDVLVGRKAEGADVLQATDHAGNVIWRRTRGTLAGVVFDSVAGRPLADAEVLVVGTRYSAQTDSSGTFRFNDLMPGEYGVTFRHAKLDSIVFAPPVMQVQIDSAQSSTVAFGIPAGVRVLVSAAEQAREDTIGAVGRALGLNWEFLLRREERETGHGVVSGRVIDEDGRGIAGASIGLDGASPSVVSGADGRFVLSGLHPGPIGITVSMLGYSTITDTIPARDAQAALDLTIRLTTKPIALDPIAVDVRWPGLERHGFYDRRESGLTGIFLTREDIEKAKASQLTDVFARMPGVRLHRLSGGRNHIRFNRMLGTKSSSFSQDSGLALGCEPDVYVDGVRIRDRIAKRNAENDLDTIDFISPDQVEGVEVYVGAATPLQYNHPCGVILLWTRRGGA